MTTNYNKLQQTTTNYNKLQQKLRVGIVYSRAKQYIVLWILSVRYAGIEPMTTVSKVCN